MQEIQLGLAVLNDELAFWVLAPQPPIDPLVNTGLAQQELDDVDHAAALKDATPLAMGQLGQQWNETQVKMQCRTGVGDKAGAIDEPVEVAKSALFVGQRHDGACAETFAHLEAVVGGGELDVDLVGLAQTLGGVETADAGIAGQDAGG